MRERKKKPTSCLLHVVLWLQVERTLLFRDRERQAARRGTATVEV